MFITPSIASTSLSSLSKRRTSAGNNKEETSAILYFFSLAATARECERNFSSGINLSHESRLKERDRFLRFFRIFSAVGNGGKVISQFGSLTSSPKTSNYIANSNFLSTIINRAAKGGTKGSDYPSRPLGGQIITSGCPIDDSRISAKSHLQWKEGLHKLMAGRESKSPWTDLCVVLFRSYQVDSRYRSLTEFLVGSAEAIFDPEVSAFLVRHLKAEAKYLRVAQWCGKSAVTDPLELSDVAERAGGSPLEQAKLRIKTLEEFIRSKGFDPDAVK